MKLANNAIQECIFVTYTLIYVIRLCYQIIFAMRADHKCKISLSRLKQLWLQGRLKHIFSSYKAKRY